MATFELTFRENIDPHVEGIIGSLTLLGFSCQREDGRVVRIASRPGCPQIEMAIDPQIESLGVRIAKIS